MKKAGAGLCFFFLITGAIVLLGLSALDAGTLETVLARCADPVGLERLGEDLHAAAGDLRRGLFFGGFPMGLIDAPLFTDREILHLKDCAGLVRGLLLYGLSAAAAGAAGCVFILARFRKRFFSGLAGTSIVLTGLMLLTAVWGVLDFDGLFITFHKVFFRNDLWLLDPRKHLLIQLMPTGFFSAYTGIILLRVLPVPAALLVFDIVFFLRRRHGDDIQ
ncbi:MAG: DUF1461 domain-containing protein [Clostridia bacterium]|nr:DUF1461 domain-containing protein [Clostridia bacterium]